MTMKRMGWTWRTFSIMENERGEAIELEKNSPKMLRWHVERNTKARLREKYAMQYLGEERPTVPKNVCSHGFEEGKTLEEWQGMSMEEFMEKKRRYVYREKGFPRRYEIRQEACGSCGSIYCSCKDIEEEGFLAVGKGERTFLEGKR